MGNEKSFWHTESGHTKACYQSASNTSLIVSHVIFETERLIGRHLEPEDLVPMLAVYGDADAMRWVGDGQPLVQDQCARWLEVTENNYRLRGYGMSALIERSSGEVVGFCGLVHPGGQLEAEIKYALKRSRWGLGLATEAARAMLVYGAEVMGLRSIIATIAPENSASHRVLVKAGMVPSSLRTNSDGTQIQVFAWQSHEDAVQPLSADVVSTDGNESP